MRLCAVDEIAGMHAAEVERERAAWLRAASTAVWARATIWGKESLGAYDLLGWPRPDQNNFLLTKEEKWARLEARIKARLDAQAAERGH